MAALMLTDQLIVSETFYSIQGEGISIGTPAVFLRLAGCNLRCPKFSYKHPETGEHLGCDTAHVWQQGERMAFSDIIQHWQAEGWWRALANGAHLVVTGGEPLIQQPALTAFLEDITKALPMLYIELETNATQTINPTLLNLLAQINASPKLSHAGDSPEKRIHQASLQQLASSNKTYFKFVVKDINDITEIQQHYQAPYSIAKSHILLMPEGGDLATLQKNSLCVVELCKTFGFRFSARLHIHLYNEATGV